MEEQSTIHMTPPQDRVVQKHMVLKRYEEQLLAARRLARFRVKMRMAEGLSVQDPDPGIRRKGFVEKVAQELYDSLIFTGSDNPVVDEIRRELSGELGENVEFTYPPGGRLRIVVRGPEGLRPLNREEQRRAKQVLWRITRQKVDGHMLEKSYGTSR